MATVIDGVLRSGQFVSEQPQYRWPEPSSAPDRDQGPHRMGCCGLYGLSGPTVEDYFAQQQHDRALGGPLPGDSDYVAPTNPDATPPPPPPVLAVETSAATYVAAAAAALAVIGIYFYTR